MFEKIKKKLHLIFTKKHEEPITWFQSHQPYELLDLMRTRFDKDFLNRGVTKNSDFSPNLELSYLSAYLRDFGFWYVENLVNERGIEDAKMLLNNWKNKAEENSDYENLLAVVDHAMKHLEYKANSKN